MIAHAAAAATHSTDLWALMCPAQEAVWLPLASVPLPFTLHRPLAPVTPAASQWTTTCPDGQNYTTTGQNASITVGPTGNIKPPTSPPDLK